MYRNEYRATCQSVKQLTAPIDDAVNNEAVGVDETCRRGISADMTHCGAFKMQVKHNVELRERVEAMRKAQQQARAALQARMEEYRGLRDWLSTRLSRRVGSRTSCRRAHSNGTTTTGVGSGPCCASSPALRSSSPHSRSSPRGSRGAKNDEILT